MAFFHDWPDPTSVAPMGRAYFTRVAITFEGLARVARAVYAVYRSREDFDGGADPVVSYSPPPIVGDAYDQMMAEHPDLAAEIAQICDGHAMAQPELAGAEPEGA